MIRRSTWIALGTLALVVLSAVIWSRSGDGLGPEGSADQPTPAPLWTLESDAIQQVVIESGAEDVLLAAQRDASAGWLLTQPSQAPADPGRLERAVSWLASPPVRAEIAAPRDLAPFELDPPRYRVLVRSSEGSERAFVIGRAAPTGDTVYARLPGREGIVLLSGYGVEEVISLLDPLPLVPTAQP
jgi:hypothetical protein